jgi:hypothetical protein
MIVNNEDLEKLEDFGFKKNHLLNDDYDIYYYTVEEIDDDIDCSVLINDTDNNDNRVRFMYCDSCDCKEEEWSDFYINKDWLIPDVIFDLIEAGIIKKG